MLSGSTLPRPGIQCHCIWLALFASTILLLCQCYPGPVSSCTEELTAMSEQVSYTSFVCCHCHETGQSRIASTFFGTRWAAELHISRSRACQAACKGIRSVPTVYRPSKRAEDQEAGAVGAPGQWPVRPEGGGGAAGNISALISAENADICNNADIRIS
jgi:hypothetical protein